MIRRLTGLLVRPRKGREAGAVAVQFAFLVLPLTVLSFGLVDLSHASSERKRLQDALDAATLAAARSTAITNEELQEVGGKTLDANLKATTDATLQSSSFGVGSTKSQVIGTATVKVKPFIANLWLHGDMTVGASSEVMRSMNKVEVAMVLDTTGSMKGTKLSELKKAGKNFIDTLSAAAARSTEVTPVKIGIVPFSNAVRLNDNNSVLDGYKAANWIDKGAAPIGADIFNGSTGVNRFDLMKAMDVSWSGCVESRAAPFDVQEAPPTITDARSLITPFFSPDLADTDPLRSSGNNYLKDGAYSTDPAVDEWKRRQGNKSKYTTAPSSSSKGPNYGCNMQPLMRLTTDWNSLKGRIDALNADGETHIPLGLMWGWHVLSNNAPFADGVPYETPKVSKIVVLMTDGDNTYTDNGSYNDSAYDGYGFIWNKRIGTATSNRTKDIDGRLALLCTNMKNAGIIIYTVRVEVKTGTSELLSKCATKPEFFYDVQSASNLNAVFSAIAGSIENLRLTK